MVDRQTDEMDGYMAGRQTTDICSKTIRQVISLINNWHRKGVYRPARHLLFYIPRYYKEN